MTHPIDIHWEGRRVSLAGRFTNPSRAELIPWLETQRAVLQTKYDERTEILIVAARPGHAIHAAIERSAIVLESKDLLDLIALPQTLDRRLERLRSLVFGPKTQGAWKDIMTLLLDWEQEQEVGIAYAEQNLASWPDALRDAPEATLQPTLHPASAVARALDVDLVSDATLAMWLTDMPASLREMRELRSRTTLWTDRLTNLARSHWGRSLRSIDLQNAGVTAENLHTLLSMEQLEHVGLRYNDLGVAGAEVIGDTSAWARLRRLHLGGNELGDEGVYHLAKASHLGSLEVLALEGNVAEPLLTNVGATYLQDAESLPRLKALRLGGNRIGDDGLRALLDLKPLEELDLRANDVTAYGLQVFASDKFAARLQHLNLSYHDLSGARFESFTAWEELRALSLVFCELTLEDLERLCANPALGKLTSLDISTYIAHEGTCARLAKGAFTGLRQLHMVGVPLFEDDAEALAEAPFASTLEHVRVDRRHRDGIRALAQALPHLSIEEV